MEAVTSLGIDWKMLIAQIINFLVLLLILNKLLYKPLISMFDQRKIKIEKGLADADKASKSLTKAENEAEKIREKAYMEANQIILESRKEAELEAKNIQADASKAAEKIIKNASAEAGNLKEAALSEAKSQISELITLSLSKIVNNKINQQEREKLTKEAISELAE